MKIRKISYKSALAGLALFFLLFSLSACGRKDEENKMEDQSVAVKVRTVSDSRQIHQDLEYPAIVSAGVEAKLIAKTSGTISGASFQVGDQIAVGQSLAKIDEIGSAGFVSGGVNSNQIKQAIIAVEQAQSSYALSRSNYENLLVSVAKDLKQAEIARDQAARGETNLGVSVEEGLKSAELAYETAKIATEQARLTLVNREKQMNQGSSDANENADLAVISAANAAGSVLTGLNNLIGLDDNNVVSVSYRSNLGALDSSAYTQADNAYQDAKNSYDAYLKKDFQDINERVAAVIAMTEKVKFLADAAKNLFDKSIPSTSLPQSSASGPSLSTLQSSASGYQSQLNVALSQARGAKQALANVSLNNDGTLDTLKQAYELSKKQEAAAAQNLNNLKAGNNSQQDQAGFAVSLAQNQYENLKVKLDSQVLAAKTQMDTAQLQYNNASVALQSLYDVHSLVSPIAGTVTQKLAGDGDTVSAGQTVAVVSRMDELKLKFFVEPEYVLDMKLGMPVKAIDGSGKEYEGLISSVAASADAATKRFQVEVKLSGEDKPLLGTVANIKISLAKEASGNGNLLVPLSAIEIGQNGNSIFLVEDNKSKKVQVQIDSVSGETAQIKLDAPDSAVIVIEGNKFLSEGQSVRVSQ